MAQALPSINLALFNSLSTKSSKIRYLSACGWSRSQIAAHLEIRYQHVRNVLLQTPKKAATKIDQMVAADIE